MGSINEQLENILQKANQHDREGKKLKVRDTLCQGLELLLLPENGLQEDVHNLLSEILRWDGNPSNLQQIRQSVSTLAQLSIERDYVHRWWTSWGIDKWVDLTYDIYLVNTMSSYTQLNMPVDAYRAARIYLGRHPTEPDVTEQVVHVIETLLSHLDTAGKKLLSRAQSALERGEFETALQHTHTFEEYLLGPIQQEFPGFLSGYEQIETLQIQAEQLKRKIQALSLLRTEVYQPLDSARRALLGMVKQLQDTTEVLQAIPDLTSIPYLTQQIQDLWQQVLGEA